MSFDNNLIWLFQIYCFTMGQTNKAGTPGWVRFKYQEQRNMLDIVRSNLLFEKLTEIGAFGVKLILKRWCYVWSKIFNFTSESTPAELSHKFFAENSSNWLFCWAVLSLGKMWSFPRCFPGTQTVAYQLRLGTWLQVQDCSDERGLAQGGVGAHWLCGGQS